MKKIFLLAAFALSSAFCYSQKAYSITYNQLKEYEGLYEYQNNATLKIAISPKDSTMYAIINDSKYNLSPVEKDLFMDMTKTKVQFFRNKKNSRLLLCR